MWQQTSNNITTLGPQIPLLQMLSNLVTTEYRDGTDICSTQSTSLSRSFVFCLRFEIRWTSISVPIIRDCVILHGNHLFEFFFEAFISIMMQDQYPIFMLHFVMENEQQKDITDEWKLPKPSFAFPSICSVSSSHTKQTEYSALVHKIFASQIFEASRKCFFSTSL